MKWTLKLSTLLLTTANEAYGCVVENVTYTPAAVNILTAYNEAYDSVSGAVVNNDTEEQVNENEMYDYVKNWSTHC